MDWCFRFSFFVLIYYVVFVAGFGDYAALIVKFLLFVLIYVYY